LEIEESEDEGGDEMDWDRELDDGDAGGVRGERREILV
jgi:hypothetical protein